MAHLIDRKIEDRKVVGSRVLLVTALYSRSRHFIRC